MSARPLRAQSTTGARVSVIDGGGANVVVCEDASGRIVVDSGTAKFDAKDLAKGCRVLFNTHYHLDQTANNEVFAAAGATIVAHDRTRQFLSVERWIPEEDRWEPARPKAARPTSTFIGDGSMTVGTEHIDYGYLLMAHTSGDIYVYFRESNVLAVGDIASPVRDPELDWFTGAWIGAIDGCGVAVRCAALWTIV